MSTFSWNVDADGDWGTGGDWSPMGPPTNGADVTIKTVDLHTITFGVGDNTASVNSLTVGNDVFQLTGGALTIVSKASFANLLQIVGGTLELGSSAVTAASFQQAGGTVDGASTLAVSGGATFTGGDVETGSGNILLRGTSADSATIYLDGGRTLENAGTFNVTGGASFNLGSLPSGTPAGGGTIKNDVRSTFDFQTAASVSAGAGTDIFSNAGLLEQTVTTGTTTIGVTFVNTGTVSVQTGTLAFTQGGSAAASAFTIASGAAIDFAGGTFNFSGGAIGGSGLTEVTGGTLEVSLKVVTAASFQQAGGTVDGISTLVVSGGATFTGGDVETGSGNILLRGTSADSATIYLDGGRTLENAGTFNVTGGASFDLGSLASGTPAGGGTIKNDVGATFDFQTAASVSAGTGTDIFSNAGLLEQTVTTGTTTIGVTFANAGTVSVQTGTLAFTAGGSAAASAFTVASGAAIDFAGGTFTFSAGSIGGSGLAEVTGGTLDIGLRTVTAASFLQSGGTVEGTPALVVSGGATFTGSDVETESGRVLLQGTSTDSATIYLDGGRALENAGTFNVTGGASFDLGSLPSGTPAGGGTIKNDVGATFDFQTAASVSAGTGTDIFSNAGLLEQTVTTGTTTIGVTFANAGTVSVQTGTLAFTAGGSAAASAFSIASGAAIDFAGGTFSMTAGAIGDLGLIEVTGGTLKIVGAPSVNFGASLSVDNGGLALGAVAATATSLEQNGGVIDGVGRLTISGAATLGLGNYDLQTGKGTTQLDGVTSDNGAYVALDGGRILENAGKFDASGGGVFILGYNPSGTSVGGGTIQNDVGAVFDFQSAESIYNFYGADKFVNAGVVTQTGSQLDTTTIGVAFLSTGTVDVASGTIEFDGIGTNFSNAVSGAGAVVFGGGGSTTFATGATLGVANLQETAAATTLNISEILSYSGAFNQDAGSSLFVGSGDKLTLSGTNALSGSTGGAGALALVGGVTTFATGATLATAAWSLSGSGTTATLGEALTYGGAFSAGAGTQLMLNAGALTLMGATTLAGATVSSASGRALDLYGASAVSGLTIAGDALVVNAATTKQSGGSITVGDATPSDKAELYNAATGVWNITDDSGVARGADAASIFANLGLVEKTGGSGTSTVGVSITDTGSVAATSGTLAFAGSINSFAGAISGSGTVLFSGGESILKLGALASVAKLSESGAGTSLFVSENLAYAGAFLQSAGSKLIVNAGDKLTLSGTNSLSGATSGAGALALAGGVTTFAAGATLASAAWSLSGSGTTATLGEALAYAGAFSAGAGTQLMLNAGALTLKGATTLAGATVSSASGWALDLYHANSVSGLTIAGNALVVNAATTTQSGGSITVGDGVSSDKAELYNAAAGVWNITDDSGVARGADAASIFANLGLVEKTGGSGTSIIATSVSNSGRILVNSGVLDFQNAITGTGVDTISGPSTLEFNSSVTLGQTIAFTGSGGSLYIGELQSFAAPISGYDIGGSGGTNDVVQLLGAWTETGFSENGAGTVATLALSNGTVHDTLSFAGNYTSTSFHLNHSAGVTSIN